MIHIIWMIEARPDRLEEFKQAYGSGGTWVSLFLKGEGYLETVLLRDAEHANRFLVIDRWRDLPAFESFKQRYLTEYNELDRRCEELTLQETKIGIFHS